MKNCPILQKSLDWCEGTPQHPGIRRRLYYCNKNLVEVWPELETDEFGRVTNAVYQGAFVLAADAYWQYIDVNIDKSTVTSEPQGEVPSQTQLNKATFVHNGIDDKATAAAAFLNNADCVFVYEDIAGHFRVLGNKRWRTKISVSQDQGQGTNPASTTIAIEVTDVIAAPFYAEGLETEDGEVLPSYDDDAQHGPRLTSPSGTTLDIGTIGISGSSVSKTIRIKGANLTQDLTLTKTGSGLTISKSSITAEEAKAGIDIILTYSKTTAGAGALANGSLTIHSSEVDKTITITARKAALTSPTEQTLDLGTVASNASTVQKTMHVEGVNLSKAINVAVSGTGFSCRKSIITAAAANSGVDITLTYRNTASGAASAQGSIRLSSTELDVTINLTAAKEAPAAQPHLTSPTVNSLDLGTIASNGTSVNKTVTVRGENVTQPVTITVSGTGFSANASQLTVAQLKAGYGLKLTYTNNGTSAVQQATGSVRIQSTEGIDKTITLTAAKEAPAGLLGVVSEMRTYDENAASFEDMATVSLPLQIARFVPEGNPSEKPAPEFLIKMSKKFSHRDFQVGDKIGYVKLSGSDTLYDLKVTRIENASEEDENYVDVLINGGVERTPQSAYLDHKFSATLFRGDAVYDINGDMIDMTIVANSNISIQTINIFSSPERE